MNMFNLFLKEDIQLSTFQIFYMKKYAIKQFMIISYAFKLESFQVGERPKQVFDFKSLCWELILIKILKLFIFESIKIQKN